MNTSELQALREREIALLQDALTVCLRRELETMDERERAHARRLQTRLQAQIRRLGGELSIPKSTQMSQKKSSLLSSDRLSYCLPVAQPLTQRQKKSDAARKP